MGRAGVWTLTTAGRAVQAALHCFSFASGPHHTCRSPQCFVKPGLEEDQSLSSSSYSLLYGFTLLGFSLTLLLKKIWHHD
ncbi:hypothetical protein JZ751_008454 [Albula glossodonta]|uniref:Uncharacterized protein n=1 Tax=Albula glossodonta TaxID=121402 RepID=A0A8T2MUD2_9TELE|nr:hypothetical protein JZ751_008454 [Albula glossodonta]